MHLSRLSLVDFRSYAGLELEFEPGVCVLVGPNGHGKTNVVEAVGYLASHASHRVAQDGPLVRMGAPRAVIRGLVHNQDRSALLELEINPGKANRARVNRNAVPRPREALGYLRTVLFAPEDLALVKGDPVQRRQFLDDLLVARAPRYAGVRADYERALKQRNTLLRSAAQARRAQRAGAVDLSTLDLWDSHLASFGAQLLAGRLRLVQALSPLVAKGYGDIAGKDTALLEYRPSFELSTGGGFSATTDGSASPGSGSTGPGSTDSGPVGASSSTAGGSAAGGPASDDTTARDSSTGGGSDEVVSGSSSTSQVTDTHSPVDGSSSAEAAVDESVLADSLLAALAAGRKEEIERGMTLTGPHRDELALLLDYGHGPAPAKSYASHGESWSFALSVKLAAFELLRSEGHEPVLVLDDVFAELDTSRRAQLAEVAAGAEQVLITAAVEDDVPESLGGARYQVRIGAAERVR